MGLRPCIWDSQHFAAIHEEPRAGVRGVVNVFWLGLGKLLFPGALVGEAEEL